MSFWKGKRVLLTGGAGFLGRFLREKLIESGCEENRIRIPRSRDTDLRDPEACRKAVQACDLVIHLAARVGGIGFNRRNPAVLFYDNAVMGIQLMEAARKAGVMKFVQMGTVCAYPKFTPVPFKEEDLWVGYPEETNAPYGLAKKMLLVQTQAYRQQYGFNAIYLLPVNLYGPGDNFDLQDSHVIPALIRKCVEAQRTGDAVLPVWGTGEASREFLYVKDCAEAIVRAAERYDKPDPVNLGTGSEIKIRELAQLIARLAGFEGRLQFDPGQPDGQPRRALNIDRAEKEFGFRARTPFEQGLRETIDWYREVFPAQAEASVR